MEEEMAMEMEVDRRTEQENRTEQRQCERNNVRVRQPAEVCYVCCPICYSLSLCTYAGWPVCAVVLFLSQYGRQQQNKTDAEVRGR